MIEKLAINGGKKLSKINFHLIKQLVKKKFPQQIKF